LISNGDSHAQVDLKDESFYLIIMAGRIKQGKEKRYFFLTKKYFIIY